MYQGKPILKKVKHINYNNPTLNSQGMKGVFFESKAPVLIRDELKYNYNFKDSLQQTVEEEQYKRRRNSAASKQQHEVPVPQEVNYGSQRTRYIKDEVLGKVTEIPKVYSNQNYNYKGFQNIKVKQDHGFDIIKNF